jgi:hypothetical protein
VGYSMLGRTDARVRHLGFGGAAAAQSLNQCLSNLRRDRVDLLQIPRGLVLAERPRTAKRYGEPILHRRRAAQQVKNQKQQQPPGAREHS